MVLLNLNIFDAPLSRITFPTMDLEGLSSMQAYAAARILYGSNVFLTGPAGTGKSELLKRLVKYWTDEGIKFALTASTGIAAVQIGGRTFHSYFKLSPDDISLSASGDDLYARMRNRMKKSWTYVLKEWRALKILVIDEISMLDPNTLIFVSNMLKLARIHGSPFGGIQILFVGDFFQLPPVKTEKFLFEYPWFYECIQERIILTEVFRQSDTAFVELLGRLRLNACTTDDLNILLSRVGANVSKFGIAPTLLWSTNRDVESHNYEELQKLPDEVHVTKRYSGYKVGGKRATGLTEMQRTIVDTALKKFMQELFNSQEPHIHLKKGAQVMLTFNLDSDRKLVNGSRGVIESFEMPELKHKPAHTSIFTEFDNEQTKTYVRNLECPKVTFVWNDQKCTLLVPFVRFSRTLEVGTSTDPKQVLLYAWATPLKLAWATTVHKSQGQSLDCVSISLDRSVFADGQAYVAISRARSLAGLTFKNFDSAAIRCNEKVAKFYNSEFRAPEDVVKTLEI